MTEEDNSNSSLRDAAEDIEPEKFKSIVFPNPEHSETDKYIHKEEEAQVYFNSVEWLDTRLGIDTHIVFGKFANAVVELENNDNPEPMDELVATLKGENQDEP